MSRKEAFARVDESEGGGFAPVDAQPAPGSEQPPPLPSGTLATTSAWRGLAERLPAAVYACDAAGRILWFNQAAAELWGREPRLGVDEWCGSWRIFRPDGTPLPLEECPMAICLREARPVRGVQIVVERPDGSRRCVRPHPDPVLDANGRLAGAFNLLLDVTEHSQEEVLRNRLAAIVESSDDAIVSKDLDGVIMSWNSGAQRLFGYTPEEAIGQSVTMLIPHERLDEEPGVLERIRRGASVDHYETVRQRKDGTLLDVSLSVSPVLDGSGRVVGASKIARDITQRKRDERLLKEADRRKDEFLATLAHELRNPLAPLRNNLELLRMAPPDLAPPAGVVEVMERQVNHLVRLVDDLLEVSRITRGAIDLERVPVSLETVVQNALEISRPHIEAGGHRLQRTLPLDPPRVIGDPTRLAQALANLLNNAAKFTPPQGTIRLTLESAGNEALIRVADSGVGIAPEDLHSVFEMFTQLRNSLEGSRSGLGIGLSLVQRLIALHGGTVEARSEGPGKGSEFIVRLPLLRGAGAAASVPLAGRPTVAPPVRRQVLVVDDNRDAAESLGVLLRLQGHEVRVVHSGAQALTLAEQVPFDAVLLDIGMPGMDGYEVASRLRAEPWGQAPLLVALTGWGQEADRTRTAAGGFDQHLVKPVAYATLERMLAEMPRRLR